MASVEYRMSNEKNQRRINEESKKNQRRITEVSVATNISDVVFIFRESFFVERMPPKILYKNALTSFMHLTEEYSSSKSYWGGSTRGSLCSGPDRNGW